MIEDEKKELLEKISELEKEKEELINQDIFRISTNTAYLQNTKITNAFRGYGHFEDWVRIKHEQGWKEGGSHQLSITFEIVPSDDVNQEKSEVKG